METSLTWLGRLTGSPAEGDWKQLLDVYGPLLAGWLARSGVPAADRDDLIQEVLLVVVRRVSEFDRRGPGAFRAWLRQITVHRLRVYWDRRPAGDAAPEALTELTDSSSPLSRSWDEEHDRHVVKSLLESLRLKFEPATWRAFERQVQDGAPAAEVAAELGLSVNAVLIAKSRVLQRLREEGRGLLE